MPITPTKWTDVAEAVSKLNDERDPIEPGRVFKSVNDASVNKIRLSERLFNIGVLPLPSSTRQGAGSSSLPNRRSESARYSLGH